MSLDFTLTKYNDLCNAITDAKYSCMTVWDYLAERKGRCIILRHDVDRKPERALKMAQLDSEYGMRSGITTKCWIKLMGIAAAL